MKKFDLNIEKILENWEVKHAIREIIANAIDEQILSNSKEIEIFKDDKNHWHIRDFGRGIQYEHFTQKENDEKLNNQGIIGKFGIGLKDALATFERHGIDVKIFSKYGDISLGKSQKKDFEDLITLHAYISEPTYSNLSGTDFILYNVNENDIILAKKFFLVFSNEKILEATKAGGILNRSNTSGNIYINGVLVAQEDNFLFSYNITLLNSAIKKALNRERTNVGRTAYTNSVKQILLSCQSVEIAQSLVSDLKGYSSGTLHDELKWIDVQEYAVKLLNSFEKVVFVTTEQMVNATDLVDEVRTSGFEVIAIPSNLQEKIHGQIDTTGEKIRDLPQYSNERSDNFEFQFVTYNHLNDIEKECFDSINEILPIIGGKPYIVKEILISETMQRDNYSFTPSIGLWDGSRIIIQRTELRSFESFLSTFLHELAHAKSGASDCTRQFEHELTNLLGKLSANIFQKNKELYDTSLYNIETSNASQNNPVLDKNIYNTQLKEIELKYKNIIKNKDLEIENLSSKKSFFRRFFK
mgnify:FL=1